MKNLSPAYLENWDDEDCISYKDKVTEILEEEKDPGNLADALYRCKVYLHKEHVKYEFGSNERVCEPISRGLIYCCKIVSDKMVDKNDEYFIETAESIWSCLDECAYYVPRDSEDFQHVNENVKRYFLNLIDKNVKDFRVMQEISSVITSKIDVEIFEKYINAVFEHYGTQKEVRDELLFMFRDDFVFEMADKLPENPHVAELAEQRLEGKDITNIDSMWDYLDSTKALKSILKISDEKAKELTESDAFDVIEKCSEIIEADIKDKEVAQGVVSVLSKLPQKPNVIKEVWPLYKAVAKVHPEIKRPSRVPYVKKTSLEIKNLLAKGKLEEAIDDFSSITSSKAFKDAESVGINRVVKKMSNGCIAVGFLCEKRAWDEYKAGWGSSGIEWNWYVRGFIIDPDKMKVVSQCKTDTVKVRDKYSASRDIYQYINEDDIIRIRGDKLFARVGGYASASTEYTPQEDVFLARAKERKAKASKQASASKVIEPTGRDDR